MKNIHNESFLPNLSARYINNVKQDPVLKQKIYSVDAYLYDKNLLNKIIVYGNKLPDSPYITEIEIAVYQSENLLYTFAPTTNFGYGPKIMAIDFIGNGLSQIFYSADSGGSGGYGYYYVYQLNQNNYNVLFDYKVFSEKNKFKGYFLDGYRAIILGNNRKYRLDVTDMDPYYKSIIFYPNGKVKEPKIDIGDVNTVFPVYNSSMGIWLLQIYQKAVGVAQVNVIGYVLTNLNYEKNNFQIFTDGFLIF